MNSFMLYTMARSIGYTSEEATMFMMTGGAWRKNVDDFPAWLDEQSEPQEGDDE